MATKQLLKYIGKNYGDKYEIKNAVFSIKTAKNFSDLEQALTINFFDKLNVFDDSLAERFSKFQRGYMQIALGQGLRFTQTFGIQQVRKFVPPQPGEKICLEVPNNIAERAEVIGKHTRLYSSRREADIMAAFDLFVDPAQLYEFVSMKMGEIKAAVSFFLCMIFEYVLAIDPWGGEYADYFNPFSLMSGIGAKWDDTPISVFGDNNEGVGDILKKIIEDLKDEIDKEAKLPNVNEYNAWDWLPKFPGSPYPQQMKGTNPTYVKKGKKLTAAVDFSTKKDYWYTIKECDPALCAAAICNCLLYNVEMMLEDRDVRNDSQFPGNLEDKAHEYGKEKTTFDLSKGKGATKGEHTKSLYNPVRVNKDDLVIIMKTEQYRALKSAAMVSEFTESGSCNNYIKNFMQYKDNIVKVDNIPMGVFKIGSKYRYNIWDLYDTEGTDTLHQKATVIHTTHRGILFGIREYVPFKYIKLHGVYVNPDVADKNIKFETAKDIN